MTKYKNIYKNRTRFFTVISILLVKTFNKKAMKSISYSFVNKQSLREPSCAFKSRVTVISLRGFYTRSETTRQLRRLHPLDAISYFIPPQNALHARQQAQKSRCVQKATGFRMYWSYQQDRFYLPTEQVRLLQYVRQIFGHFFFCAPFQC